jgi:putative oxidoreductase
MESDIALLVLRVGVGVIFVAHGLQKLLGWWGGPGWEGWKGFVANLGIRPARVWAGISLTAELGGGLALIAGFLVPLAAAGLVAQSLVLTWAVHRPRGFWTSAGGVEFPLAFLAGAFAVQVLGPGSWSLDALLREPIAALEFLYEPAVRWAILGIAALGAILALLLAAPPPPPPTEAESEG